MTRCFGTLSLGLLSTVLFGCTWGNEMVADGILDKFEVQVEGEVANTETQKVDILWVIDNSVSMCQEQNSLAENVGKFREQFEGLDLNLRMAVVTTDGLSASESGAFHADLAPPFPPNCFEKVVYQCLAPLTEEVADACVSAFDVEEGAYGAWVCEPPPQNAAANLINENGSLNSNCRYKCVDDADCVAQFGNENARCVAPGGDENQRGCLIPPAADEICSESDLPLYVETDAGNLDLFPCIAVVGALQDPNPQLEQGLNTAMWALDQNPPDSQFVPDRSAQAKNFVRPDAYQIIIFISDEDDCSLAPGIDLPAELRQTCACLPTVDEVSAEFPQGGYLAPISSITSKLRSINSDPSKVLVAAIVGDVVVTDQGLEELSDTEVVLTCAESSDDEGYDVDSCVEGNRTSYVASKCGPKFTDRNTYVCESTSGKADYGSRYLELVRQFGANGVSANICSDAGFGPALDEIAKEILTRIVRVCLPQEVKPGTDLVVSKTSPDGVTTVLEGGEEGAYQVLPAQDCPDLGSGTGKAVFFKEVLEKGETVSLSYQAPLIPVQE